MVPQRASGATEGARIIDVRGPQEFAIWHLPGAENVPLPTLREAQESWDRSRPIRLYCAVGFRSYLAYRALVQRGFTDVRTLSGGMTTFRSYHDVPAEETVDSTEPVVNYGEDLTGINTARAAAAGPVAASGVSVDLDCTGLACPGPIMALQAKMAELAPGDASLPELIASAQDGGVRLIACTMTMDLLGIAQDDLIDGVELGGAAMFFGEANESNGAFFI